MVVKSTQHYTSGGSISIKKAMVIICLMISCLGRSQIFSGAGGAILDNGNDTYFPLTVSGLNPAQIDSVFGLEQVCLSINHSAVSELYMYLQSPSGLIVNLTLGSSSSGSGFLNTCFESGIGNSITMGTPPYTGTYSPVSYLGRFNTNVAGDGTWTLIVHDGFPGNNTGTVLSWSLRFGNAPAHPVVFKSSNLPIVVLSASQAITDIESSANIGIIDNGAGRNNITDAVNNYSGKVGINVRGSSTKNFEKKSYSFETQDAAGNPIGNSILGMPSETDWVLNASYIDKTLLRNAIAFDISRGMGHYAPRYRFVELLQNNEYRGVYMLAEKPKRDLNRINIKKLGPTDEVFPDVTGGYVIKIDRNDEAGWYSNQPGYCTSGSKFYYQYIYPRDIDITNSQKNYIQNHMNNFEKMMNLPTYLDPGVGYAQYIDVGSFVDYFIVNELSKNVDAYRLSTYMYKDNIDQGGKIFIGPVWDYDIAWHNCNYGNSFDPTGWAYQLQVDDYPSPTWWVRLMQDPSFLAKVNCRWADLRKGIISPEFLNNYIDGITGTLAESQERNFRQWPLLGAYIYPNPQNQAGANYATEIADLKNWIASRIAWLDANLTGPCAIGLQEQVAINDLMIFPNPMQQSATFSMNLETSADVALCITDMFGKEVARYLNTNVAAGPSKIVFEKNQIRSGIYLYQLQVNNTVKTGKIIIL